MKKRERKYWIIVASKDHVRTGVQEGIAQACHGKSAPLKRMQNDDIVIFYSGKQTFGEATKCQEFTAIGKVKDDSIYQVEMTPGFCPFRLDIEFFKSKDVSIIPFIDDLDFITNKQKWGYPFRWGMLEIKEHDFQLISGLMLLD